MFRSLLCVRLTEARPVLFATAHELRSFWKCEIAYTPTRAVLAFAGYFVSFNRRTVVYYLSCMRRVCTVLFVGVRQTAAPR